MKTFYEYFQCRRVGQGCEPAIIPACPKNKRKPLGNCLRARLVTKNYWRRRRDSNPRDPFESSDFQDRRFQPLTHSSAYDSTALIGRLWASPLRNRCPFPFLDVPSQPLHPLQKSSRRKRGWY